MPSDSDFEPFLRRDLKAFFTDRFKSPVSVEPVLLRDGPTQSGVSYPKYYAWVVISVDEKTVDQGAVRLEAVDKARFVVTTFLSAETIRNNPEAVSKVFPLALIEVIVHRAREALGRSPTSACSGARAARSFRLPLTPSRAPADA